VPGRAQHPLGDAGAGEGGQRRLAGRLPQHRVPAHQGDGGVPAPDRHGEVERGDHAGHPQGVPLLLQPVLPPLAGQGAAVELPGQAHGQVTDVDHLLHFAQRLPGGLAHLQGDQGGQVGLPPAQFLAQGLDHLAALGRGHQPPVGEGSVAAGQDPLEVRRVDGGHRGEGGAVHGRYHRLHGAAAQPFAVEAAEVVGRQAELVQDRCHGRHPYGRKGDRAVAGGSFQHPTPVKPGPRPPGPPGSARPGSG